MTPTHPTDTDTDEIPAGLLAMTDQAPPTPDDDIVDGELVDTPANGDKPGNAVEIHNGNGALVQADEWSDVDDMDLSPSDRFVIPLLQLNRKVDGGFVNEDTGEIQREIDAVLMAKVNTRAWWPEAFGKGDAAPACRSDDGIEPNAERSPAQQPDWQLPSKAEGETPASTCAACPNSQWDGDNPPACTESIEFLAFVPTDHGAGKVVRLRFGGLALGPARRFWESFKTRLPKRPPIAYLTHIALQDEVTDNGTFLVPTFRRQLELDRAGAQPILEARDQRQLEWRHAVSADERPVAPEPDGAGPFDGTSKGTDELAPGEEPF